MDMQSQITRPSAHEDPIRIHHPEEEEHQEKGASKVLRKVKEKAKKIKNSLTKHGHGHGHEHDHDEDEEDDEYDEQDPEVHGAPVYESSRVMGEQEPLSHLGVTNVPAPEDIIPPGTKVFPVVSSDQTRPIEPEPLRDASYGHEAPLRGHEAQYHHPLRVSDISEREESREAHHMPMNTPVSLLSATEDVTRTFAPGEDEFLGGQQKVNIERPKRLEEDPAAPGGGSDYLSGVSNYQSKVTDPTRGGGEAGVPKIAESLGRMKVTDESHDQRSGIGFERDLPTRSHESALENVSGIGTDSPMKFAGDSRAEPRKDFPTRSDELLNQKIESVGKNSPTVYGGESGAGFGKDFPGRSNEYDVKNESGIDKNSATGFGSGLGAGVGEDFPARSHEFGLKNESGMGKDYPMGTGGELGAGIGDDFQARSHELGGIGRDSRSGGQGYGDESETGLEKNFPAESGDGKAKTELPSVVPTGTHDQFSPELSPPKERDDFESKGEERLEPKPSTYTEKFASATSAITDTAIAAKNAVASRLGYSGETAGVGQQESPVGGETPRSSTGYSGETIGKQESPVGGETPRSATGYGQKVAETMAEKLSPVYEKVKETGSTVMTKLPLSGGGSGAEAHQGEDKSVTTKDYLADKLRPGDEDKALSEVIAEKLNLGGGDRKTTTTKEVEVTVERIPADQMSEERELSEATPEEVKGGGMVGKIKGAVNSWLGGTTEEVKPRSPASVEESSQSIGSTVGTMGFSDSGRAEATQRGQ